MAKDDAQSTAQRCADVLRGHYGDRLAGAMLYGSEARAEPTPESDIALLVSLKGSFDFFARLRMLVDLIHEVQLNSDRHISVRPAGAAGSEAGSAQFHRDVKREGVAI